MADRQDTREEDKNRAIFSDAPQTFGKICFKLDRRFDADQRYELTEVLRELLKLIRAQAQSLKNAQVAEALRKFRDGIPRQPNLLQLLAFVHHSTWASEMPTLLVFELCY